MAFGPLGLEDLSWQKYVFRRNQLSPAPLKQPAAVGGILIFSGVAAIVAGLEFSRLLYLMRLAGESPGYASLKAGCPMSVHRC
jgi:hypothetical protein